MESRLDTWKKKLLDMSKRNPLLNYRDTRRSSLRIKYPEIGVLWNSFVTNEQPLEFPFTDEEQKVSLKKEKEYTGTVETNQSIKDQQLTLENLRKKAKMFIHEQGINVLYLSFGFLRWTEADHSSVTLNSPLILVPVSLTRKSLTSPFVLSLREDEITVNATLSYKLDNDFGIKVPAFEENLEEYFQHLQQLVSAKHWEIVPEVGLCLLSFHKINMYHDLEKHQSAILNHPLIRALCGDNTAVAHDLSSLNHFDHDRGSPPEHTFQIVDADASQQDAILCAKKGYSFILQGPPGTGKSQTITNIIAECLADGKKVLFVSEKAAALDVVHKRLKDAKLDDFCLILHSDKENKKDTLSQFNKVLALAGQHTSLREDAYQKLSQLEEDRTKLNEYSNALFSVIEPLHKTIYDVNGILASLSDYQDVEFSIDEIRQVTSPMYTSYVNTLDRLSKIISSMNNDYQSNPWYGAETTFVSNELRSDISVYLERLIPKVRALSELSQTLASELDLSIVPSYSTLSQAVLALEIAGKSPKVPLFWLFDTDKLTPLAEEAEKQKAVQSAFLTQREAIRALHQELLQNDRQADFSNFALLAATAEIDAHLSAIRSYLSSAHPCYADWECLPDGESTPRTLCVSAAEHIGEYKAIRQQISESYENEIFTIDYDAMYLRFKEESLSAFKILKSQYRSDKKKIQSLTRTFGKTLSDEEVFSVLQQLRQMSEHKRWMEDHEASLLTAFGTLYQAENTDFAEIERLLNTHTRLQTCVENLNSLRTLVSQTEETDAKLQQSYGSLYAGLETDWDTVQNALDWAKTFSNTISKSNGYGEGFFRSICTSDEKIEQCRTYAAQIKESLADIAPDLDWFRALFQTPDEWHSISMSELLTRLNRCKNDLAALEEWIDFRTARSQCNELGLGNYILQIEILSIDAASIVPVFKKRFFRLWLDCILPEYPIVATFRRKSQEAIIKEFHSLDKLQFDIASARIRAKLIETLPSMDQFTSGTDEMSILRRELNKQRRIMPIRLLFQEIPNLILSLKPCLMMSPLSVSMFLEADAFTFDTVIFDEASQVCTENAIGAILRGKQVVIAGDKHQLPPTDFFSAVISENDFDGDEEEDFDDNGAYESLLDEALLPERTLHWHYRSRHEHLIAFSNAKFYNGDLITFPSNVDRAPDIGVEYIHVPAGVYDRGGKKGNVIEAERVADLVFEHFQRFPARSLGVIAFGSVQQQAIETALQKHRKENQQFESFFDEEKQNAFFVKNLENVQGDERDTIIFSIGYAKDASGTMRMNFGPLSKAGGERRLNVAITRAKYNVKLVSSIHPTDINLEKISYEGPKLLRSYIEFAMRGPAALQSETTESSHVQHDSPFEESVYTFLTRKGYQLATQVGCSGYRIDMAVKHPTLSGRYVLGIECDGASYHSARTARERDRLRQDILESMGWKIHRIWSTDWIKDPVSEGQRLVEAVEEAIKGYVEDGLERTPEEKPASEERSTPIEELPVFEEDGYRFDPPAETDFRVLPRTRNDYLELTHYVADCIALLVQNEWPIHYELICQKLKMIKRQDIDRALRFMNGRICQKGSFFYPPQFQEVPVRQASGRTIEQISPDELAAGMLLILKKQPSLTRPALIATTISAFGLDSHEAAVTTVFNTVFDALADEGELHKAEEVITADQMSFF